MIVVVCVDDQKGMMFNKRRQSQDKIMREDLLKETGEGKIWMNAYSRELFADTKSAAMTVDGEYLKKAGPGDYCFVEDQDIRPYQEKIEKVIFYKWNRVYPADFFFSLDMQGWKLTKTRDFAGSSHEKITKEVYVK